jgi:hypothetical protein
MLLLDRLESEVVMAKFYCYLEDNFEDEIEASSEDEAREILRGRIEAALGELEIHVSEVEDEESLYRGCSAPN